MLGPPGSEGQSRNLPSGIQSIGRFSIWPQKLQPKVRPRIGFKGDFWWSNDCCTRHFLPFNTIIIMFIDGATPLHIRPFGSDQLHKYLTLRPSCDDRWRPLHQLQPRACLAEQDRVRCHGLATKIHTVLKYGKGTARRWSCHGVFSQPLFFVPLLTDTVRYGFFSPCELHYSRRLQQTA